MFFFLIIKIEFFSNSYFGVDNSKKHIFAQSCISLAAPQQYNL